MEARVKDHAQSLKEKEDTLNWRDEEARKKINELDNELANLAELADQKTIDTQEENERNKLSVFRATNTVKRLRKRIEKIKATD